MNKLKEQNFKKKRRSSKWIFTVVDIVTFLKRLFSVCQKEELCRITDDNLEELANEEIQKQNFENKRIPKEELPNEFFLL